VGSSRFYVDWRRRTTWSGPVHDVVTTSSRRRIFWRGGRSAERARIEALTGVGHWDCSVPLPNRLRAGVISGVQGRSPGRESEAFFVKLHIIFALKYNKQQLLLLLDKYTYPKRRVATSCSQKNGTVQGPKGRSLRAEERGRRLRLGSGSWGGGSQPPPHQIGVLGERCKLPQRGPGQSPGRNWILVKSEGKRSHLVTMTSSTTSTSSNIEFYIIICVVYPVTIEIETPECTEPLKPTLQPT